MKYKIVSLSNQVQRAKQFVTKFNIVDAPVAFKEGSVVYGVKEHHYKRFLEQLFEMYPPLRGPITNGDDAVFRDALRQSKAEMCSPHEHPEVEPKPAPPAPITDDDIPVMIKKMNLIKELIKKNKNEIDRIDDRISNLQDQNQKRWYNITNLRNNYDDMDELIAKHEHAKKKKKPRGKKKLTTKDVLRLLNDMSSTERANFLSQAKEQL